MNTTIVNKWRRGFNALPLSNNRDISDLLPGDDPKIEVALAAAGFNGTLYAVDNSKEALARLIGSLDDEIKRYRLNPRKYKIKSLDENVISGTMHPSDYIVGNHIIDDLLSYEFCKRNGLDPNNLAKDAKFSREVWDAICNDTQTTLHNIPRAVFGNALSSLSPWGIVALASYESRFEREHGFGHETQLCKGLFIGLREYGRSLPYLTDKSGFVSGVVKPDTGRSEQWIAFQKAA